MAVSEVFFAEVPSLRWTRSSFLPTIHGGGVSHTSEIRCLAWSEDNFVAFTSLEGLYDGACARKNAAAATEYVSAVTWNCARKEFKSRDDLSDVCALTHPIYIMSPDQPAEHWTLVTAHHRHRLRTLRWAPLCLGAGPALLSADECDRVCLWQPITKATGFKGKHDTGGDNEMWECTNVFGVESPLLVEWLSSRPSSHSSAPFVSAPPADGLKGVLPSPNLLLAFVVLSSDGLFTLWYQLPYDSRWRKISTRLWRKQGATDRRTASRADVLIMPDGKVRVAVAGRHLGGHVLVYDVSFDLSGVVSPPCESTNQPPSISSSLHSRADVRIPPPRHQTVSMWDSHTCSIEQVAFDSVENGDVLVVRVDRAGRTPGTCSTILTRLRIQPIELLALLPSLSVAVAAATNPAETPNPWVDTWVRDIAPIIFSPPVTAVRLSTTGVLAVTAGTESVDVYCVKSFKLLATVPTNPLLPLHPPELLVTQHPTSPLSFSSPPPSPPPPPSLSPSLSAHSLPSVLLCAEWSPSCGCVCVLDSSARVRAYSLPGVVGLLQTVDVEVQAGEDDVTTLQVRLTHVLESCMARSCSYWDVLVRMRCIVHSLSEEGRDASGFYRGVVTALLADFSVAGSHYEWKYHTRIDVMVGSIFRCIESGVVPAANSYLRSMLKRAEGTLFGAFSNPSDVFTVPIPPIGSIDAANAPSLLSSPAHCSCDVALLPMLVPLTDWVLSLALFVLHCVSDFVSSPDVVRDVASSLPSTSSTTTLSAYYTLLLHSPAVVRHSPAFALILDLESLHRLREMIVLSGCVREMACRVNANCTARVARSYTSDAIKRMYVLVTQVLQRSTDTLSTWQIGVGSQPPPLQLQQLLRNLRRSLAQVMTKSSVAPLMFPLAFAPNMVSAFRKLAANPPSMGLLEQNRFNPHTSCCNGKRKETGDGSDVAPKRVKLIRESGPVEVERREAGDPAAQGFVFHHVAEGTYNTRATLDIVSLDNLSRETSFFRQCLGCHRMTEVPLGGSTWHALWDRACPACGGRWKVMSRQAGEDAKDGERQEQQQTMGNRKQQQPQPQQRQQPAVVAK